MCGLVEEEALTKNMELMGFSEGERNAIRKRHVRQLREEQDRVLRSHYAQRDGLGGSRAGSQGQRGLGREKIERGSNTSVLVKWNNKMGMASWGPRQEGNSEQSRQGATSIEFKTASSSSMPTCTPLVDDT